MLKATDGNTAVYYTRGFELISIREGTIASYYIYDGGLSVRALTNEAGTVTDTLVFDAFGNETGRTGTTDSPYGFQGEEQDATGLYYLRARYMDPATGTFTTMDIYGGSLSDPMSLHKYLFANSNPVMYSDPSGHVSLSEQLLVSALIGELISSTLYLVELFTTDNIQYDKPEGYIWGGLGAAIHGMIMGVAFSLLYMVFAFLTTAYIAGVIFGVSGFFMAVFGMLEGADNIENGDTFLGWTKVIINAIIAVVCVISLANCAVSESVSSNNNSYNNNEYINNNTNSEIADNSELPTTQVEKGATLDENINKRYTPNQDAVIQLAKEAKRNGGVTYEEAVILLEWAEEYNVPYHDIEVHPNRPGSASNIPHFHIGKTGHIPIIGDIPVWLKEALYDS